MSLRTPLVVHLLRGFLGAGLLTAAVWLAQIAPAIAVIAGISSLIAFGGCPTCWLVGLWKALSHQSQGTKYLSGYCDSCSNGSSRRNTLLSQQGD